MDDENWWLVFLFLAVAVFFWCSGREKARESDRESDLPPIAVPPNLRESEVIVS